MASNPQIISDLRVIQEADHDIELLTLYKGVPFICKAKIESIGENLVRIRASGPSMICLESDPKPRVLGSDYFEPSVACVASLDIQNGMVELNNFSYVGTKLGERMIVRVEPGENLQVEIEVENQIITGYIADISINGMGARIAHAVYTPLLKPGTGIMARFHLPTGKIDISGTVLSALKLAEDYRLSIRFNQNGPQKALIFQYLIDRRAKIEEELNQKYNAIMGIG